MLKMPHEALLAHMRALAARKSEKKAAASRINGKLGGRPPTKKPPTP